MQMTAGEIYRDYLAAANQKEQVKILAQLNETTEQHIIDILKEMGVDGRKFNGPKKAEHHAGDGAKAEKMKDHKPDTEKETHESTAVLEEDYHELIKRCVGLEAANLDYKRKNEELKTTIVNIAIKIFG